MEIRRAEISDFEGIWPIMAAVARDGTTHMFPEDLSFEMARDYWFLEPHRVYVAVDAGEIVGTFILRPNHWGRGDHISNASFMVGASARGKGVGFSMGEFAVSEAKRLGYLGMQFNSVVSTNEVAIRLWEKLGFEIIGRGPGVFRHRELGNLDSFLMFRKL